MNNRDHNRVPIRLRRTHPFYTTFNLFTDSGIVLPNLRMNPAWFKQLDTGEPFILQTDEWFPYLYPDGTIGQMDRMEWILSYHLEDDNSIPSIKFKRYDPLDIVVDHNFHTGINDDKAAFVVNVHKILERMCLNMEPDQMINLWEIQYNYFNFNPQDKTPIEFLSWTKDLVGSWPSPHRNILTEWIRGKKLSINTGRKSQSQFWQYNIELIIPFLEMLIKERFIEEIDRNTFQSLMSNPAHDFSIKANWIRDKRKLIVMFDMLQNLYHVFGHDHRNGDPDEYRSEYRVRPKSIADRFLYHQERIIAKKLSDERQAAHLSSWTGEIESLLRSL